MTIVEVTKRVLLAPLASLNQETNLYTRNMINMATKEINRNKYTLLSKSIKKSFVDRYAFLINQSVKLKSLENVNLLSTIRNTSYSSISKSPSLSTIFSL